MSNITVTGLADLQKMLDTLPAKVEANIMRGALRVGMKLIQADAKQHAAVASGLLRDGLKIYTGIKDGRVTARLKVSGKHAYLARWIEYGTAAHRINTKKKAALFIGGIFAKFVDHPGAKAHAFLRHALDARAQDAVVAAGEYIKKRLATKEGLDTADIWIEGES